MMIEWLLVTTALFYPGVSSQLGVESSLNYVVDILDAPVIKSAQLLNAVRMFNDQGHPYTCQLPDVPLSPGDQAASSDPEDGSKKSAVMQLLAPMRSLPCLVHTKDWWTYELCPMSGISQYHMEAGKPVGVELNLGVFESEHDWDADDGRSRNARQRYHSQTYVNGSVCELTDAHRSAEVRYECDEQRSSDALVRIDEPQSCRYILTVMTSRLCSHPVLRSPPTKRPLAINCRPELSAHQLRRLAISRTKRLMAVLKRITEHEPLTFPGPTDARTRKRAVVLIESYSAKLKEFLDSVKQVVEHLRDASSTQEPTLSSFGYDFAQLSSLVETQDKLVRFVQEHPKQSENMRTFTVEPIPPVVSKSFDDLGLDLDKAVGLVKTLSEEAFSIEQFLSKSSVVPDDRFMKAVTNAWTVSGVLESQFLAAKSARRLFLATSRQSFKRPTQFNSDVLEARISFQPLWSGTDKTMVEDDDVRSLFAGESSDFFSSKRRRQRTTKPKRAEESSMPPAGQSLNSKSGEKTGSEQVNVHEGAVSEQSKGSLPILSTTEQESEMAKNTDTEAATNANTDTDNTDTETVESGTDEGISSSSFKKPRRPLVGFPGSTTVRIKPVNKQQQSEVYREFKRKLESIGVNSEGPDVRVQMVTRAEGQDQTLEHRMTAEEMEMFEKALMSVVLGGSDVYDELNRQKKLTDNYRFDLHSTLSEDDPYYEDDVEEQ